MRSARLGTLLREHRLDRVDVLKVDVEGADILALTSNETLARVGMVIGELHPSILKMSTDEALDVLQRHGGFERGWMRGEFVFALTRSGGHA